MDITEVRIKLMEDNSGSNERLQAFCSITFDNMFVIRDLKIIEGAKGFFVAMPSRKLTDRCHHCGSKNHLRSRFCYNCGARLDENRAARDPDGRAKLHADIAHPINSACREAIQAKVLEAYAEELERSKMPGYVSRYDELDAEYDDALDIPVATVPISAGHHHGYGPTAHPAQHGPGYGPPVYSGSHGPGYATPEPPLRRGGPLRGHTSHGRSQILRGPHVSNRRGSAAAHPSSQGHPIHEPSAPASTPIEGDFGSGL